MKTRDKYINFQANSGGAAVNMAGAVIVQKKRTVKLEQGSRIISRQLLFIMSIIVIPKRTSMTEVIQNIATL